VFLGGHVGWSGARGGGGLAWGARLRPPGVGPVSRTVGEPGEGSWEEGQEKQCTQNQGWRSGGRIASSPVPPIGSPFWVDICTTEQLRWTYLNSGKPNDHCNVSPWDRSWSAGL
jgi:hypothetical protein